MAGQNSFLLYGATGYTAGLVIGLAERYGLQPILAGRNREKIQSLAQQYNLPYRIAALTDAAALDALLKDITVVLHAAGPFSQTALPMQQACLRSGTHYLDITGEIAVFEQGALLHQRAVQQNILLLSGAGFDVVPTDCMALHLAQKLPGATHLQLAIASAGGAVSHGTAITVAEGLGHGGMVRRDGRLQRVPTAHKTITVPFTKDKGWLAMAIPWGDLSTAYRTTGIPNIETFMAAPPSAIRMAKWSNAFNWLLRKSWVKRMVQRRIDRRITGPDEAVRQKARSFVWGKAWNESGETVAARLSGPDGYTLTAHTALLIARKVLQGNWQAGFHTPAGLYGADLILEVEGTQREDLPPAE